VPQRIPIARISWVVDLQGGSIFSRVTE
jgi:hypothetical protein